MIPVKQKYIIINSTILFVIASIVEMTLHEFGHFLASVFLHAKGVSMHHNYVSNIDEGLSLTGSLIIKGAGPLVSLLIGILFHFICFRHAKRNAWFLFNLYMSAFGYIGFFGYLMIAPIFTVGDTGYICFALGFPIWLTITIALAGAVTLYFIINGLMKYFAGMGTKEIIEKKEKRNPFIRSLLLYPVLLGIFITTLLNLPVVTMISLIAPVCSPFTFFWAYGNAMNKNYPDYNSEEEFEKFNKQHVGLYIFFLMTIIFNRLLVSGIYMN